MRYSIRIVQTLDYEGLLKNGNQKNLPGKQNRHYRRNYPIKNKKRDGDNTGHIF